MEKERPPVHLHRPILSQRQRALYSVLTDIAPGADDVGDDVDLKRFQGAHRCLLGSFRSARDKRQMLRQQGCYLRSAAIFRIRSAVKSSAGKNVSSASSDSVISTGVPKIIVVEKKLKMSPPSRILNGIATLSDDSGADRAGIGKALRSL